MEEESLTLVPMALIYRFVFILFLDVVKNGWKIRSRTSSAIPGPSSLTVRLARSASPAAASTTRCS